MQMHSCMQRPTASHTHTHTDIVTHNHPLHPAPHTNIHRVATTYQETRSSRTQVTWKAANQVSCSPGTNYCDQEERGEGKCGGLVNKASVSPAQTSLSFSLSSSSLCFYILLTQLLMSKHSKFILTGSLPLSHPLSLCVGGTLWR